MSDRHGELLGVAVMGAVAAASLHERDKTGKWPLAAKALLAEIGLGLVWLVLTIASGFTKPGFVMAEFFTVVAFCLTIAWLVIHMIRQGLKATHPSNFPQFENRPVPELAREIIQSAGKSNMVQRYIILHHDPTTRQVIVVPGKPDRIQCQADGFWYDWNQHVGAYIYSEV